MNFFKRMPLHYQIFLALVVGAVVGLVVNPREKQLADGTVAISPLGKGVALVEIELDGTEGYRDSISSGKTIDSNRESFKARYRNAADAYLENDLPQTITLETTKRSVHFTEELEKITVRYSRQYNGNKVQTNLDFTTAKELKEKYPQFAEAYQEYAKSFSRKVTIVAKGVGDLFLRLLRMITVPLIVVSLVTGVASLGSSKRLGAMFGKTLLYYVCTSLLAITTGILMVNILNPGINTELPGGGSESTIDGEQSLPGVFMRLLNNMIPQNPIHALANGEFLSIITFSILLGLFIIRVGGKSGETMRGFFQSGFDVMMSMTMFIIKLAPIGVLSFMLYATASQGWSIFSTFGWYMLTVFLALAFHACVVLPLILKFVARRSPWEFAKSMSPALLTAFSTASSNGTLPLTMTSVEERAGVSNRVSSFVLPLGATINMDGTALYEAVAVLFIAQAYNNGALPLDKQILVAVTALLASVGAAGIPSAGLVMMAIVLQAVKLPLDAQGLIIAVDRVLDMLRTSVNVWSDSCGCAVLERLEGTRETDEPCSSSNLG
jgi:proton glutamate symport protein